MSCYIDTSVLTSYYCPEDRSERSQHALRAVAVPVISPLVEVELHCAVSRKVRAGALPKPAAMAILAEFRAHVAEPRFRVVGIESAHYLMARDWIARMAVPLRVLDALHLAVAKTNDLKVLTADRTLAASGERLGLRCALVV